MLAVTIVIASILLHVASCYVCWKHLRLFNGGWGFLMASFTLMIARRSIVLYDAYGGSNIPVNITAEVVAMTASLLLLIGLIRVGWVEHTQKKEIDRLKSIQDDVKNRIKKYS